MITRILLIAIFLTGMGIEAQTSFYDSDNRRLYIPDVKSNDEYFVRAFLSLDENGKFNLDSIITLSPEENQILGLIDGLRCELAHPLAKLATGVSFSNDSNFCLKKFQGTTVEGGQIYEYLLSIDGELALILDRRGDGYRGCCFVQMFENISQIQAGRDLAGEFVPWSEGDEVLFDEAYYLKIEFSDSGEWNF